MRRKQQDQVRSVVDAPDRSVFGLIRDIRGAIKDDGLSDAQKVGAIRSLLNGEASSASFENLKAGLEVTRNDPGWHEVLERKSQYLQNRLSPILRTLTFRPIDRAAELGAPIKELIPHLEHPFFGLSKRPMRSTRTYKDGRGNCLKLYPGPDGLPTVFDQDVLIYCCTRLIAEREKGRCCQEQAPADIDRPAAVRQPENKWCPIRRTGSGTQATDHAANGSKDRNQ